MTQLNMYVPKLVDLKKKGSNLDILSVLFLSKTIPDFRCKSTENYITKEINSITMY